MSLQHIGKGALRVAKNYTKGYSDVQAKVRDATSNDPWGPSGTQMNEIAQLTYNQNDFVEIMEMLDKRLNDKGKNWRHVFKTLTLLDYCLHAGSENVVIYFRDNVYLVKTLKEFQYIDEDGKDQGANVRQKAKDITNLLQDESRLRQERRSRASMRDRMTKGGGTSTDDFPDEPSERVERRREQPKPSSSRKDRDEDELKKAMEASKRTFEQEAAKGKEDADLKRAMQLSEKEERDRAKAIEEANSRSLFDDSLQTNGAAQPQANPFPLIDAGLQPQYTQMQPQFTSFNPYAQAQQEQQAMMQAQWAQQQAEWQAAQQAAAQQEWANQQAQQQQQMAMQNEWARQQAELAQQNEWAMQQQQQAQQNAWLQQQQQQQQPIFAQPTGFGSKNPFALGAGASSPPPMPSMSPAPSTNGQHQQPQQQQGPSPSPQPLQVKPRQDENTALAALFANRDAGVDTFGNFGNLRYGASGGKLMANPTGASSGNPYAQQQRPAGNDQPFFSV